MKRVFAGFLLLCMLACVPTPDEEFIVYKGEEKDWEKQVAQIAPDGAAEPTSYADESIDTEAVTDSPLYARLGAPKTFTLDEMQGKVRITAPEAPVILPEAERVPAVEVQRHTFTQEDVEAVAKAFFGNRELTWYPYGIQTKESIAELIRMFQELLPTAEDETHADYWAEQIKKLGEAYADAPSQDELQPITLKPETQVTDWHGAYDNATYSGLRAWTTVDGERWNIMLNQNYGQQRLVISTGKDGTAEYDGHPVIDAPYHVDLSKADAIRQGNQLIGAISDEYALCFVGPACANFAEEAGVSRNWGWGLVYMRCINGFPSAYASKEPGDHGEATDMPPYERIFVVIDDQGVSCLDWQTPMEIMHVLGTDETLLSFDEATAHAKNMIVAHWAYNADRDPDGSVKIEKVKLGLCRIAKKGGGFYYVPAYFFFTGFQASDAYKAQYRYDETHEEERREIEEHNGFIYSAHGFFDEYNAIVINALDGTSIDLANGY